MAGGEPGVPNLDVQVARTAALSETSQRALEVNAPTSQEQDSRHTLAREVRARVEASPKPLGTLAERFGVSSTPPKEVAQQRARSLVSKDSGLSPQAQQEAVVRSNAIQTAEAVARSIVDVGGINYQNPDTFAQLQTSIRDLIPEITDVQLTSDQVLAFADALIKDPEIFQAIVRRYNELQSREAPKEVAEALEAKAKADKAFSEAEAAKSKAEGEKSRLEERQASLDPENNDPDSDNQRLVKLDASTPQVRYERKQRDYTRAEKNLDALKARYGNNPTDQTQLAEIQAAEADADSLYGELGKIQQDIAEQARLTKERRDLPGKIAANDKALEAVTTTYGEAKNNQGKADTDLSLARGSRVDFESDYLSDLGNIVRDSAIEVIDSRVQKINQANNQRLVEEARSGGNKVDEDMTRSLGSKYLKRKTVKERTGIVRRKTTTREDFEVDSQRAEADVKGLLSANSTGTRALVETALTDVFTPKDAQGNATGPVNQAEVNRHLNDPAFMARWGAELGIHAIKSYLQTGGKITDGQARYIDAQPWGKGVRQKAMASPEVAAYEAALKEKGALPPGGINEALSTEEGRKKHLALIFKIAAGIVGAMGAVALSQGPQKH